MDNQEQIKETCAEDVKNEMKVETENDEQVQAPEATQDAGCECAEDTAEEQATCDCTAKLLKELEEANKALADAQEETLRARAEVQNMRRRCDNEIEKASKYAITQFANSLLPVIEPIEKALQFADRENEATKNIVQGVELTYKLLMKALNENHLNEVNPEGEVFDPNLHHAIQMVETDQVPANHIVAVLQKGYVLNGRVLRPAMVTVSKGVSNSIDADA